MTLPLELGPVHDPAVRRAFEQLAQQFPIVVTGGGGGAPSGPAGGDLGSTYPNPTVVKAQAGFTVGGVGVILSTDPSVTNARAPTGSAGGDLSGTYPNPDIAAGVIVNADVNAAAAIAESKLSLATDAAAGTGSRRTIGTGALQAAAGNDARLSDARTPTAHHTTHEPGGTDAMAVDAAAATGSLRTIGTGALQAAAGNDSRLTNARTPTAHATTHQPGGADAMAVDAVAATGSLRTLGTGAAQAAAGNDSRFSDARTPTAHQATHQSGNADALTGNLDATARSNISKAGTLVGTRRGLNLIQGSNITLTTADNSANERVDVTIAAAAVSGSEVSYNQITSDVTVTVVAEASAVTVVTATALTGDGSTPYLIEFYAQQVTTAAASSANVVLNLWDGSTNLGFIGQVQDVAAAAIITSLSVQRRIVPSAASHTYSIRAWATSGSGLIGAGAGTGAGTKPPAFIRITRA